MVDAFAIPGLPPLFGRARDRLALRGRRMLGGGLLGVRHAHDRLARAWTPGRRPRADAAGSALGDRRRPVSPGLLDRRRTSPDPRPLARPRPPLRRVLRPQPNAALASAARGLR